VSSTDSLLANEYFQVKYHGEIALVIPSPEVEQLPESLMQPAASMLLSPLKEDPPSHVVVDLTGVRYFGSAFITFLLRLHLISKQRGSELILAGVNSRIRELLKTTALDTIWALYETRQEALDALGGSD
jgi:anti-sigma B factor antagonist